MRVKLRQLVFTFLLERNPPHFVLTKLIKILIDIGKLDWPDRYPDFFAACVTYCNKSAIPAFWGVGTSNID